MPNADSLSQSPRFLSGDGVMARLMREFDWESTELGGPRTWPGSLCTTVAMLLRTRLPAFLFWGPRKICFYNDAFAASLGPEKHPGILGMAGAAAFPESWADLRGEIEQVLDGGPATWHENRLVPMLRNGRMEDVYWTYSYAGVDDEGAAHGVGGVLVLCTETTQLVLANKAAELQVERLGQLFDQAPIFLAFVSGKRHRFEFINPAYTRLIGGRDVVGLDVIDALPEIVGQGHLELLDAVWETGQAHTARGAQIHLLSERTGQVEPLRIDFAYQPTVDATGAVSGILVVGVDVTERVATEAALKQREESLRLATEASGVALWDIDPATDTLFWPPPIRQMFGVLSDRPVTLRGDFYPSLHPDDKDAVAAAFRASIDPTVRALYDVEYRAIGRDDGAIRWVAAKGRGFFDEKGRCVRVIGTAVDVTDRKHKEAQLIELNETLQRRLSDFLAERKLFADVVEASDSLIQVIDVDYRILATNPANVDEFERIYGVRPKVGDDMLGLIAHLPEHQGDARREWARALAGETFVEQLEFGVPSLSRRWYELHFQPLYSVSGSVIGAFQFGFDVTARRLADARLVETEAALQQAQRMEVLGLLTGGLAHDFNNVLQALNTKFELIRRKPDDPRQVQSWAASGVETARRGARVTAQLLAFSRRQSSGDRPLRLKSLLADVSDLLRTTLGAHTDLHIDSEDVWVRAESTQLEMALLNLAVNARDAMAGRAQTSVRIEARQHGETIDLAFTDTGTGMSQEVISKAFTPFYSTKEFGKGSGLGLAQVSAMTARVGGSVRIESDGRNGTTVVITLQRAERDGHDGMRPADRELSVMVVDDDASVRTSLAELLRGLGHRVVDASGGEAALSILATTDVELLLSDFQMDGMNGVTLANLARALRPGLKVVFMSGYADIDEITQTIGQSATLLRKPFDADTVHRTLEMAAARLR